MSGVPKHVEQSSEEHVPAASDLDHLADYFDRTDSGGLDWQEATNAEVEHPELEQVSIRLPKDDLAELKRRAARAGVGYTTLVRMILREYLRSPLTR